MADRVPDFRWLRRALACALLPGICIIAPASPGHADEGSERNRAVLDACLSASDSRAGDAGCRDLVYQACEAESGDTSTLGMSACLEAEIAAWDAVLNRLWRDVRAEAEARDVADPAAEGANLESLLAAQRAWIAFRDADCANAYQRFGAGSIRVLIGGACMAELTSSRVMDFRSWFRDGF